MTIFVKQVTDNFDSIMSGAVSGDTVEFVAGDHPKWGISTSDALSWGHLPSETYIIRGRRNPHVITDSNNSMPVLVGDSTNPTVTVDADSIIIEPVALEGAATMPAVTVEAIRNETVEMVTLGTVSWMPAPTVFISGALPGTGVTVAMQVLSASAEQPDMTVLVDADVLVILDALMTFSSMPAVTVDTTDSVTVALDALVADSDLPALDVVIGGEAIINMPALVADSTTPAPTVIVPGEGGENEVDVTLDVTTTVDVGLEVETTLDLTLEII